MSPFNVLHLSTYLQGGAGQVTKDLAIHQSRSGGKVTVVVSDTEYTGYGNDPGHLSDLRNEGIELFCWDSLFKRNRELNGNVIDRVSSLLKQQNYDIIHAHAAIPSMIGIQSLKKNGSGLPVLQTMQGWGQNKTIAQEKQDLSIMEKLRRVVVVSSADQTYLSSRGMTNLVLIPNAIQENVKMGLDLTDREIRAIDELKSNRTIIGCIGSLCARKNQALLLDAVGVLSKRKTQVGVLFIGEGDPAGQLLKKCQDLGIEESVLFLGYKPMARALIPRMDVLCLPSLSEGLPLTILEGFCDKVPVVGSRIPCIEELIVDGETGFLFEPTDPVELADCIERVLRLDRSDRTQMIDSARRVYQKEYSLKLMLEKYDQLYGAMIVS